MGWYFGDLPDDICHEFTDGLPFLFYFVLDFSLLVTDEFLVFLIQLEPLTIFCDKVTENTLNLIVVGDESLVYSFAVDFDLLTHFGVQFFDFSL